MSAKQSTTNQLPAFWFEEATPFNARGLRRCRIPGCGISGTRHGQLNADFWRDREQHVLVRFSWAGWAYHYRAVLTSGEQVPEAIMDALLESVENIQLEWSAEAPDVPPDVPTKPD